MPYQQRLSRERALPKIKQYCAYQERCHKEVREKLYSYGLYKSDVEILITTLIEESFLDEERFAIQYAGGKFRIRSWGRIKIMHALKDKQVSAYCMKRALAEIGEDDYEKTLMKLAVKKWDSLSNETTITRQAKTTNFLLQKGYESGLIRKALSAINEN